MVSGFFLGISIFNFMLAGLCFYLSTKLWNGWEIQVLLGVINSIAGIINMTVAFT